MIKLLSVLLVLSVLATGCMKNEVLTPQPQPTANFSRTLTFPNRNGSVKAMAYGGNVLLESIVHLEAGKLRLFFNVPAKTDGSTGEGIWMELDAPESGTTIVGAYHFAGPSAGRISNARYIYQVRNSSGDIWGSITEKAMGTAFGGMVQIEHFNERHRTISGNYRIEVPGLINDPTDKSTAIPIDPENQCDLLITGRFENIRVH